MHGEQKTWAACKGRTGKPLGKFRGELVRTSFAYRCVYILWVLKGKFCARLTVSSWISWFVAKEVVVGESLENGDFVVKPWVFSCRDIVLELHDIVRGSLLLLLRSMLYVQLANTPTTRCDL